MIDGWMKEKKRKWQVGLEEAVHPVVSQSQVWHGKQASF